MQDSKTSHESSPRKQPILCHVRRDLHLCVVGTIIPGTLYLYSYPGYPAGCPRPAPLRLCFPAQQKATLSDGLAAPCFSHLLFTEFQPWIGYSWHTASPTPAALRPSE